jgi:PAS domain S-box-containing protein
MQRGLAAVRKQSNVSQPLVQASLIGEAIDAGPVLVFVFDEDGRYVAANQEACDVLGYERDELVTLTVDDVALSPEAAEVEHDASAPRAKRGRIELTRKDGSTFLFEYRSQEAVVAGLTVYVSVGWPADEVSEAPAPRRRSARARG